MRRILALISIIFAIAAFVLLCLVLPLHIDIKIPIILFVIAFMLLITVKRMKSDEAAENKTKQSKTAFDGGTDGTGGSSNCHNNDGEAGDGQNNEKNAEKNADADNK